MPHEIIGDVIVGVLEVGAEAASSTNKKNGLGCLLTTIILVFLISLGIYFIVVDQESNQQKGIITKKLPNDKMVIRTEKGEDIHIINHELYLNKQEGDSIILNN